MTLRLENLAQTSVNTCLSLYFQQAEHMEGIWILVEEAWDADEADIQIWGDTCKIGLVFWIPSLKVAFIGDSVIEKDVPFNIFYNEALTVLTALEWSSSLVPIPRQVAIHTDSTNSLNIFNSLCASDIYNSILMSTITIQIDSQIDLRVFHIQGNCNTIVDALLRCNFNLVRNLEPTLSICHFMPPLNALRVISK